MHFDFLDHLFSPFIFPLLGAVKVIPKTSHNRSTVSSLTSAWTPDKNRDNTGWGTPAALATALVDMPLSSTTRRRKSAIGRAELFMGQRGVVAVVLFLGAVVLVAVVCFVLLFIFDVLP
jgi:hypothetical protein